MGRPFGSVYRPDTSVSPSSPGRIRRRARRPSPSGSPMPPTARGDPRRAEDVPRGRHADRAPRMRLSRSSERGKSRTASPLAVVDELQGDVEVLALEEGDDLLEVVLLLGADPQLVTLDLSLDALRALIPHDLGDLLRVLLVDALLQADHHAVLLARQLGLPGVEDLEREAPLDQLRLEDIEYGVYPLLAVGLDLDALLSRPADRSAGALEVEPVPDLLDRLVQRVVDLLPVDLDRKSVV